MVCCCYYPIISCGMLKVAVLFVGLSNCGTSRDEQLLDWRWDELSPSKAAAWTTSHKKPLKGSNQKAFMPWKFCIASFSEAGFKMGQMQCLHILVVSSVTTVLFLVFFLHKNQDACFDPGVTISKLSARLDRRRPCWKLLSWKMFRHKKVFTPSYTGLKKIVGS